MKKNFYLSFIVIFIILFSTKEIYSQMFWNRACSFAGTSTSYVAVPNHSSLNLTGSFTLEAWINPASLSGTSKGILSKGGAKGTSLIYAMRLLTSGRVSVITNGASRLTSKVTNTLPLNTFTHVAASYNSSTNVFSIYINGALDTTSTIAGVAPVSNSDSLFIGISGASTPFSGILDEIRIWNRALSLTEVSQNRRTSLGVNTGIYSGLVLSLPFQSSISTINSLSMTDFSGNTNNGNAVGVTDVNLRNRPYTTIEINDCVELDGSGDYISAVDNPAIGPTTEVTLEAWIFPRSTANAVLIHKGGSNGSPTNYRIGLLGGILTAAINTNFGFTSDDIIPLNRWTHVAFTYVSSGLYCFYLNGELIKSGINNVGAIVDGTDSLYIGGSLALTNYNGYIDEVRITEEAKTEEEINKFLYTSIDDLNEFSADEAVYNMDGLNRSSTLTGPFLNFRNNARFSCSGTIDNQPISPLNRADNLNFQEAFYLKKADRRIPASGTLGDMIDDTLDILHDLTITDINVYIALNHTFEGDLDISLIAPNDDVVILYNNASLISTSDNIITIFDDGADSSLINNRYVSFAPVIKPTNNMNTIFSGDNSKGKWKLKIHDQVSQDSGRLYTWGIQFNNATSKNKLLSTNSLIQGFYNSVTDLMVRDTMRYYFRNISVPYTIVDSAKAFLQTDGSALLSLTNVKTAVDYFIQLKHRNSIETWSAVPIVFDPLTSQATYKFINSSSQAYGNNMVEVDNAPVRFAIYSGDVDQDGLVDISDLTAIDNDAFNFVSGYVRTDLNGDNFTDLADYALADNNAFNFVSKIVPPGALDSYYNKADALNENKFITGDPNISNSNSTENNIPTNVNKSDDESNTAKWIQQYGRTK